MSINFQGRSDEGASVLEETPKQQEAALPVYEKYKEGEDLAYFPKLIGVLDKLHVGRVIKHDPETTDAAETWKNHPTGRQYPEKTYGIILPIEPTKDYDKAQVVQHGKRYGVTLFADGSAVVGRYNPQEGKVLKNDSLQMDKLVEPSDDFWYYEPWKQPAVAKERAVQQVFAEVSGGEIVANSTDEPDVVADYLKLAILQAVKKVGIAAIEDVSTSYESTLTYADSREIPPIINAATGSAQRNYNSRIFFAAKALKDLPYLMYSGTHVDYSKAGLEQEKAYYDKQKLKKT